MSGVNKITAERNQRTLLELVNLPGNDVCADCKARAPRWASYNIGVFLCMNCASIHRKIGTHVTKIKSLTLDSWTKEQVEVGNVKGNALYNPDELRHPPPTNLVDSERDSELERFIRAKYEYKKYIAGGTSSGPSVLSASKSVDRSAAVAALLGPSRSASTRLSRGASTRRETAPPSSAPFSSATDGHPPLPPRSTEVQPPLPPRPQPSTNAYQTTPGNASTNPFPSSASTNPFPTSASQPAVSFPPPPKASAHNPSANQTQTITHSRTVDATLPLQVLAQPVTQQIAMSPSATTPFTTTTNPYSNMSAANPMNAFSMGQPTVRIWVLV
ncbi:hypothetical protein NM688_g1380 [Phlebia brevispora]|uniref:Uncharacterized protein n=1 Tax=Phlebia brevispora TaxID=194682 RepID=A0ACC1TBY0_9APHY|nr:hypothetical protein NM688_g1380 [Phlebia brevispora]